MTDAAITVDDLSDVLVTPLRWFVGDSWIHNESWAVLVQGQAVDLTSPGWSVRAQARPRPTSDTVLAQWSTGTVGPEFGQVELGTATVVLPDRGELVTSTVRLRHSADVSRSWGAFAAWFDCEIELVAGGIVAARYTIAQGAAWAVPDTSR